MKTKSSKNDLTHEDILRFRKLESAFLSRCKHFGYREIKTSTVEPLYIFTALGALRENKLNRIYSFIDWDGWSGERVALYLEQVLLRQLAHGFEVRRIKRLVTS